MIFLGFLTATAAFAFAEIAEPPGGFGRTRLMGEKYWANWTDADNARIDADIERYRKADCTATGFHAGEQVKVEQLTHAYLFGANFFLFGHQTNEHDRVAYEGLWKGLFNAGTVALYWKDLEPERGRPRYAADSPFIWRRPPVDPVVAFCEENGIDMNGHAIVYGMHFAMPTWVPVNRAERERDILKHVFDVVTRYRGRIRRWDVVNEATDQPNRGIMPDDYTFKTFKWAESALGGEAAAFGINDMDTGWGPKGPTRRYVQLTRDLIARGAKVDHIGVESHIYRIDVFPTIIAGEHGSYVAKALRETLDSVAEAGVPIYLSELTIPAPDDTETGFLQQAELVRNFYRAVFSHPSTRGITWWNVVDKTAFGEEPKFSGLLDERYARKPACHVLDALINREWKTRLTVAADANGTVRFRGFRGKYRLTTAGGERTVEVE